MPLARTLRLTCLMLALAGAGGLGACVSRPAVEDAGLRIDAAQYPAAFQAAKDVLRDAGFTLDRVDARHGVITTAPRASAGPATPWIPASSTPGQAFADLIHNQARSATVEFLPGAAAPPAADLRTASGPIEFRVVVEVLRATRTGRRVDSTLPRRSTFVADPVALRSGEDPASIRVVGDDPPLAAELASRISDRIGGGRGNPRPGAQ